MVVVFFLFFPHARVAQPAKRKAFNLAPVGFEPHVGCSYVLGLSAARAGCEMGALGIEPRAFRMQSGCNTITPCA